MITNSHGGFPTTITGESSRLYVRPLNSTDPVARRLVSELQDEYRMRYGEPDADSTPAAHFRPPDGTFLAAFIAGEPVACGGLRRHDAETAEVKRIYVPQRHRCRGYAGAVLIEIERFAVRAGYQRLVLETGDRQPEAVALYRSCGYRSTEPFGYYAHDPRSIFFVKSLDRG